MLFKRRFWDGIAAGTVTLTFRRWRRPQARPGGAYRTPAGVIAVEAVDQIAPRAITAADARRAGYDDRDELVRDLGRHADGVLYRIRFRFAGVDRRTVLRRETNIAGADWEALRARLARLDAARATGPWTARVLRLIAARPGVRAGDLAAELDRERLPFKADVRKLKELGLTESLEVGYRLSPRGRAVLRRL